MLISTYMLSNPIPDDFSEESIKLLSTLKNAVDTDLLISIPIQIVLNRKWDKYGYAFYLV